MTKTITMNLKTAIDETNGAFARLSKVAETFKTAKSDSELPKAILTFTPGEWCRILIAMTHWRTMKNELRDCGNDPEKILEWRRRNAKAVGVIRDMALSWSDELPTEAEA